MISFYKGMICIMNCPNCGMIEGEIHYRDRDNEYDYMVCPVCGRREEIEEFSNIIKGMKNMKLYHITKSSNVDSIMEKGLIPNIGRNRKRCMKERKGDFSEKWISLCNLNDIKSWRKVLYKKDESVTVLSIDISKLDEKKERVRYWSNGTEYGYFGKIDKELISIYKEI